MCEGVSETGRGRGQWGELCAFNAEIRGYLRGVGVTYSLHTVLLPSPLSERHFACMKPLAAAAKTNAAMATPPQARATASRESMEREVDEMHKDDQKEGIGEEREGGGG